MNWLESTSTPDDSIARVETYQPLPGQSYLHVVTNSELDDLRRAIARRELPLDFETKLDRLSRGNLTHRFVERTCRLFAALIFAAQEKRFPQATEADCERLVRVLAYVRKEDDVVADYKPNGFLDDQQEIRVAMTDLAPLLKTFKAWRLEHQVPELWLKAA
jgi:hypothetical protein